MLTGSIDTFAADRLGRVLVSSPVQGPDAVLDVAQVDFVDVAGARAIARWAQELRARSTVLVVQGASPLLRRMWRVLALDRLAPVRFTEAAA
ncbi:STAS domain-containing protein [Blastococcus brunescens]|uniref:STAS domain-containing protein n=1 Tax=Blastococcus brunescens TaxID=1564165 RepID=A0ABZ1B7J3_9ACTN|nr:STAS domain-containing protein [Blastococcus sp. BMG 8361]WRL66792.1 STAS domain-containing protein [Blastococcus sp. BMG 8361]